MSRGISLLVAVFLAITSFNLASAQSVKTNRWIKDFEQVRTAIARHYADLDEALEKQGINPTALNNVTLRAIRNAKSDGEARLALQAFVTAFGDRRLSLGKAVRQPLSLKRDEALMMIAEAGPVCGSLRFNKYDPEPYGLGVLEDYAFNVLVSINNVFGAGIVEAGPRGVGYVRVPSFRTQDYYSACLRAWRNLQAEREEPCDGDCLEDMTDRIIPNMLIDDFARRIESFSERRVGTVIIDLTGTNGNGRWASSLATLLAGDAISCPTVQVPRSSDWRKRFSAMSKDLGRVKGDGSVESLTDAGRDQLSQLEDQTRQTCRRPENLWTDAEFDRDSCQGLTTASLTSCGLLSRSPNVEIESRSASEILFQPDYYSIAPSPKPAKIFVVIDEETSGAAEELAAMLQDAVAATIVGKTSAGSGCVPVPGEDSRVVLRRSGLQLNVPNCRVLREDGSNAAAGVSPDEPVGWTGDANSNDAREAVFEAILP